MTTPFTGREILASLADLVGEKTDNLVIAEFVEGDVATGERNFDCDKCKERHAVRYAVRTDLDSPIGDLSVDVVLRSDFGTCELRDVWVVFRDEEAVIESSENEYGFFDLSEIVSARTINWDWVVEAVLGSPGGSAIGHWIMFECRKRGMTEDQEKVFLADPLLALKLFELPDYEDVYMDDEHRAVHVLRQCRIDHAAGARAFIKKAGDLARFFLLSGLPDLLTTKTGFPVVRFVD